MFLSLELSTHQDTLSAISHLKIISDVCTRHGDKAILTMATTLEAMTHLRQSNSTENIEQAQRALAVARSQQLDPAVASLPQLATLVQCVDLCSTLQKLDPPQAELKMRALQSMLDTLPEGQSMTEEGLFAISIAHAGFSATKPSMGVVRSMPDGSTELVFNWLPREDIYALGCLLSGIAITHRNTTDGQKAERMLKEGLRSQDGQYSIRRITIFADVHAQKRSTKQTQSRTQLNLQHRETYGGKSSNAIYNSSSHSPSAYERSGLKRKNNSGSFKKQRPISRPKLPTP